MEPAEIRRLDEQTQRHWWYRSRLALARGVMKRATPSRGFRALEIGCGCGGNMAGLADLFDEIHGIDNSMECLRLCRRRGILDIAAADAGALPFKDATFDAAFMFDVLEHLDDEKPCISETRRVLAAGGALYVTVPALAALWSVHDEAFHHRRRYDAERLRRLLEGAGFAIRILTYWSFFPLAPVFIQRKIRSALGPPKKTSDFNLPQPHPFPELFSAMQALERFFIIRAGLRPPAGVSLFALALKT